VNQNRRRVRWIVWTTTKVDHLRFRNRLFNADRTRGIGVRLHEATIPGTRSRGDGSRRIAAHVVCDFQRGPPSDRAIDATIGQGNCALDNSDELSFLVLDYSLQCALGLVTGARHD